jgi:erythromycin esterase-like protein
MPEGRFEFDPAVAEAIPVRQGVPPDDALFDLIGDAHVVLIGEASHGTREFYAARAAMTRRLIEAKGFAAVAVEADWPDAYRVNRFVRGRSRDSNANEALGGFERFPAWMWRNTEVMDFVGWLREHNDRAGTRDGGVGFYGLDLYSLYRSIDEVLGYLDGVDPAAAARARDRYACFDQYGREDGQEYGFAAAFGAGPACQQEVIDQLVELQRHGPEYVRHDGPAAADDLFHAQQNARTVQDAERYYRAMFDPGPSSWNLRDRHMVDTLRALREHLGRGRPEPARIVVWAHNSHVGDARTTEVAAHGEVNVGQLVRERYPGDSRSIGFSTYTGTVTAADEWGGPAGRRRVRPGLPGSVEELFHRFGPAELMISFDRSPRTSRLLGEPRLERAIGVVYRPGTERQSHYFHARVPDQFDAVIHIDDTRAVEPLDRRVRWAGAEPVETYPAGV